ncbi:lysozyme [Pantoea ananatis]|uniref:lysozyme n=1 Tax=Pantoea ananas TaxID=553 RepID=UPI003FA43F38
MKTSQEGIDLIKHFEGVKLKAYQCPAGIWTIGYGHTNNVKRGDVITEITADKFLRQDLESSEKCVITLVKVDYTQSQFDAMVSFVFNLGQGAFRTSTLLKKINSKDYAGASMEFIRWVNVGGVKMAGLILRRRAEKILFDKK